MWWFLFIAVVVYLAIKILDAVANNDQHSLSVQHRNSSDIEWMFPTKVVGVSHRNGDRHSRQKIIREHCHGGQRVRLVREPNNKFDSNAISVWTSDGLQIGYLSAEIARIAVEKHEAEDLIAEISEVTGGEDHKYFGVNLRVGKRIETQSPKPVQQGPVAVTDNKEPF